MIGNGGASKSNNDRDVCEVNDMLQKLSTGDNDIVSVCANCGKEGAKNICSKCKVTTYCNAVCKKIHKKKHKKDCEEHQRLATEKHNEGLRIAAELHDENLFKQPPPVDDDCPICFLRMPTHRRGWRYMSCCGKAICCGCFYAPVYDNQGNKVEEKVCAFCRLPRHKTDEEANEREKNRMEAGDPLAIYSQGNNYRDGEYGYPQDHGKALELWHRAGELGCSEAYCSIGCLYAVGQGVDVDTKKATHYYEIAAMGGCELSRRLLGNKEVRAGNFEKALKHFFIAVERGDADSLEEIKQLYSRGYAMKKDYTKALQSYQKYLGEIKSDQRDKAAADREDYRYY